MTRQQAIDALIMLAELSRKPAQGDVVNPATLGAPQINNLADPSVFVENGTTYVYGTSTYHRVPVHTSGNIDVGVDASRDAMPTKPAWAASTEIWAPTVSKLGGRYVMFFAAHRPNAPQDSAQCIGRAWASAPTGPFEPEGMPAHCGNDGVSGALDPSVFIDPSGQAWLLVTMGGSNANLWSFRLDQTGALNGAPNLLLKREQPWQDWFLENPAMFFDGKDYLLAYSAGRWQSESYMTGVARCATPTGPCTDASRAWLTSTGDRSGPGGLEFFVGADGAPRVAFHSYVAGQVGTVGKRHTHIRLFATDPWPRLV